MEEIISIWENDPLAFFVAFSLFSLLIGVICMMIYQEIITRRFIKKITDNIHQDVLKTDFNEMCISCFSEILSCMSKSQLYNIKFVESCRVIGCYHMGPNERKLNNETVNATTIYNTYVAELVKRRIKYDNSRKAN